MEASSLLRELRPGQETYLEIAADQRSKIDIILRHRNARIISQEPLPDNKFLLFVKKRSE